MTAPESVRLRAEATAWFTRLNGRPTPQERADFQRWQGLSDAHGRAWAAVSQTWHAAGGIGADLLAEGDPALMATMMRIEEARRRKSRLRNVTAGLVLALALIGAGWVWRDHPNFLQDLRADMVTGRGERRDIVLADGSRVLLDADTAISLEFGADRRGLRILRGAAWFDVTHSALPFTVTAKEAEVRVLGTSFDVELGGEGLLVTLERGAVEVAQTGSHAGTVRLSPGEALEIDDAGIGQPYPVDVAEVTAWREGHFVFNDMQLADVVARIARYREGRIVVFGSSLAERRISGALPLDDPDRALQSLRAMIGFNIDNAGGRLTILRP